MRGADRPSCPSPLDGPCVLAFSALLAQMTANHTVPRGCLLRPSFVSVPVSLKRLWRPALLHSNQHTVNTSEIIARRCGVDISKPALVQHARPGRFRHRGQYLHLNMASPHLQKPRPATPPCTNNDFRGGDNGVLGAIAHMSDGSIRPAQGRPSKSLLDPRRWPRAVQTSALGMASYDT
ncbi:hypothetical protein CPLU01_10176 [Colletotrichum plurivorum]|uniref:Uncharacterized protein n=1 Tax=Colletotrichum plurivorum TaxID=2175906 RepID=A0A8H6K6F8_9PEZI|nr:hypothetical protein CPLU01_10176 [Colletotrichum plurivorum]